MQFAKNLKKVRTRNKMSQEELAHVLGVSRQAVASYEAAKREPSFEILLKIADHFQLSTDYLLGRHEYSIEAHSADIIRNIANLVNGKDVADFVQEVGMKTGILITLDQMERYLYEGMLPDTLTLKVLALYAGLQVEYFYQNHG